MSLFNANKEKNVEYYKNISKTILFVSGYFDIFSGYQETIVAKELAKRKNLRVYVATSNLSCPIFTLNMLRKNGLENRYYKSRTEICHGYTIIRDKAVYELRSMVWTKDIFYIIEKVKPETVIAVNVGQLLPLAGGLHQKKGGYNLISLYGDNYARMSHLPEALQKLKLIGFFISKGLIYKYICMKSAKIFINTEETKEILKSTIRRKDLKKIEFLPLGFDSEVFFYDSRLREGARKELGIDREECVFISAGKMRPEKEYEVLVDIFREIDGNGRKIKLLLVGFDDSKYSEEIMRMIANDARLQKIVITFPFSEKRTLNKFYNCADFGIWHKQPAISIQQGMGTGMQVIIPRTKTLSHLIQCSTCGIFFEHKNYGELKKIIESVVYKYRFSNKERLLRQRKNLAFSYSSLVTKLEPYI